MQGADDLNIQGSGLLQQILYLYAEFAHDADVVAACLVGPVLIHVESAEFAEAVGGEQYFVAGIVGHHDFRPVNHGSGHEGQGVLAETERVAFFDDNLSVSIIRAKELLHHGKGLCAGHDGGILIKLHKFGDIGGMVRLHVLYDQVIRMAVAQKSADLMQPFLSETRVYGVHNGDFLIQDDIGIVGHAVRNHVLTLEEIHIMVIDAHVSDIFGNFHCNTLLLVKIG